MDERVVVERGQCSLAADWTVPQIAAVYLMNRSYRQQHTEEQTWKHCCIARHLFIRQLSDISTQIFIKWIAFESAIPKVRYSNKEVL